MGFRFEKFTDINKSFAARVTIRQRTGQIGFNQGAINRFALDKYRFAVLYYDCDSRVIGIQPVAEATEGAIEIKRRPTENPTNTYISAKNFLDKYAVEYRASHGHELKLDESTGFLYLELQEVVDESEEESEENSE
jgi:hypothetical protein